MTVLIILREAFLKDNNIRAIKSLKLTSFKCKNDLRKFGDKDPPIKNIRSITFLKATVLDSPKAPEV